MISNVVGSGGITVVGGYSGLPYIPSNSNNPIQGMVRVQNNNFQVFDGSSWVSMSGSSAHIQLDDATQKIIAWAKAQMERETRIAELAVNHESVAFALQAAEQARQELDLIVQLCSDHTKSTQNVA